MVLMRVKWFLLVLPQYFVVKRYFVMLGVEPVLNLLDFHASEVKKSINTNDFDLFIQSTNQIIKLLALLNSTVFKKSFDRFPRTELLVQNQIKDI